MNYRLEFEIPGLPRMTNPSGRSSTHWRVIKRERDLWLAAVGVIATPRPLAPLKRARLTLTRFSSVSPDPDGLVSGFKAIVDGLVHSGVLVNDKWENIGMPNYRWEKCKPKQGKVHIIVEGEE